MLYAHTELDWERGGGESSPPGAVPPAQRRADLACGEPGDGNLIVQGDNLVALKALLPYYAGQVKCIYIDPPYNTGADERNDEGKRSGWIYNDNVNSLEIREWLGKVVGEEAEDLSRHDKWLCMMYPRIALLQKLLRQDAVIFASIDEIEVPTLRLLFDEIFGAMNRIGTLVWKNVTDNNPTNIATEQEYVLCYARNKEKLSREWKSVNLAVKDKLLTIGNEFVMKYSDPDKRQKEYTKWFRENKDYLGRSTATNTLMMAVFIQGARVFITPVKKVTVTMCFTPLQVARACNLLWATVFQKRRSMDCSLKTVFCSVMTNLKSSS